MEQFNKHLRKTKKGKKTLYGLLQSFIVRFICLLKIKSEGKPTSKLTNKLKSGSPSQREHLILVMSKDTQSQVQVTMGTMEKL